MNILMKRWMRNYGLHPQDEILKFSMRLLDKSEERFQTLMEYHRKQFLNLSMYQKPPIESYKIIFSAELLPTAETTFLTKGSEVMCESAEGEACIYTTDEDTWFSHAQINQCYFTDEIGHIYSCLKEGAQIFFSEDMSSIEKNEIEFHFDGLFDLFKTIKFSLYFTILEKDEKYLLNTDYYTWSLKIGDQEYDLVARKITHGIHFTLVMEEAKENQTYSLCLHKHKSFLSLRMKDVYVQLDSAEEEIKTYFDDERKKSLRDPIFDTALSLFHHCYLSSELLSHQQGVYTLQLYINYQMVLQEPLIPAKDYKLIMKYLPKKQLYYDAFCEQVQLSYFNGEDWVSIPEFDSFIHSFKEEQRYISFSFTLPKMEKLEGMESGYLLRFTNVFTQDTSLYPLKYHVPTFTKIHLSYARQEKIYPKKVLRYQNLERKEMSRDCQYGSQALFDASSYSKQTMWLAFYEKLPPIFECFLKMEEESDAHHEILCTTMNDSLLRINDETSGLSHHGKFTIFEGDTIKKTVQFNEEAYWIKLTFDECIKKIAIQGITYNCVSAKNIHHGERYYYFHEENSYLLDVSTCISLCVKVKEYDLISQVKTWVPYTIKNEEEKEGKYMIYDEISHTLSFPFHVLQELNVEDEEEILHVSYEETTSSFHTIVHGNANTLMESPRSIPNMISVCENYGYEPTLPEDEQFIQASWKLDMNENIIHIEDMIHSLKMQYPYIKEIKFSYEKNIYNESIKHTLFVVLKINNKDNKHFYFYENSLQIKQRIHQLLPDDTLSIVITKPLFLYVSIQVIIKYENTNQSLENINSLFMRLIQYGNHQSIQREIGEYISEDEISKAMEKENLKFHSLHIQVHYYKNNIKITRNLSELPYFAYGLMINEEHKIMWMEESYV